jgi:hypothetical protein
MRHTTSEAELCLPDRQRRIRTAYLTYATRFYFANLILTIVSFVVRKKTDHPASVSEGNFAMDQLIAIGHYGLHVLTALKAVSGLVLAAQTDLPLVVLDGIGTR